VRDRGVEHEMKSGSIGDHVDWLVAEGVVSAAMESTSVCRTASAIDIIVAARPRDRGAPRPR
jgi:hypothetical protein